MSSEARSEEAPRDGERGGGAVDRGETAKASGERSEPRAEWSVSNRWRPGLKPLLSAVASAWVRSTPVGDDVESACRFLGVAHPARLLVVSDGIGVLVGLVGVVLASLFAVPAAIPLALGGGLLPPFLSRRGVVVAAALVRTRALGAVPSLYVRLVLRLRVEPSLGRAVHFAARAGDGRLSEALESHAHHADGTPEAGLRSFAAAWGEWEPSIERASALVVAASRAPADARQRGCERALETVLDATQERLARFASDVRAPVTGLYAFGVLLPLALIGVLPAARVAGVAVPTAALVALYDVVLPVGLAAAGLWLLTRRSVAFPAPRVTRAHPAVPDRRLRAVFAGIFGGAGAGVVAYALRPWSAPLVAVGVGVGLALVVSVGPARDVHGRIRELERGLPDALTLVGRRVGEGVSVERALRATADELPGTTGELFSAAVSRGDQLRIDVHGSFLGPRGVFRDVPSRRARDVATLLTLAATEGQPAGDVLVAAGDHLRELRRVEREARRELAAITGTLTNTAVLFGPLVGGVTVAMAGTLGATSPDSTVETVSSTAAGVGAGIPPAVLGRAVGLYVLLLTAELTALSTALERGLDTTLVAYRVGVALPVASLTYLVAVVVAGRLF